MNTRNTVSHQKNTRLGHALFIFETLCEENNRVLIDCLRDQPHASLLDLSIQSGLSSQRVEMYLEQLCLTGIVVQRDSITGSRYHLDLSRLAKVRKISREMARFVRD